MGEGMPILVVLAGEALDVIVASLNRALLWSLVLVSQHVCFQVFKDLSTLGIGASSLLFGLLAAEIAILAVVRLDGWSTRWRVRI